MDKNGEIELMWGACTFTGMAIYTFLDLPEPEVMDLPLDKQPYFDVILAASEKKMPLAASVSKLLDKAACRQSGSGGYVGDRAEREGRSP